MLISLARIVIGNGSCFILLFLINYKSTEVFSQWGQDKTNAGPKPGQTVLVCKG